MGLKESFNMEGVGEGFGSNWVKVMVLECRFSECRQRCEGFEAGVPGVLGYTC